MNTMTINTYTGERETVEVDLKTTIVWDASEWAVDGGQSAAFFGFDLDVFPEISESGKATFAWTVKASFAVSEWPELFDCGVVERASKIASTGEIAQWFAERAARRAVKSYIAAQA